jgi:hypothetical protein
MERWYRSSTPGSKPLYGFGTLEQAFNFANRLNRTAATQAKRTSGLRSGTRSPGWAPIA